MPAFPYTDLPFILSVCVAIVGGVGMLAALIASIQVKHETALLNRFHDAFTDGKSWQDGKDSPDEWLAAQGITGDSHIGQQFVTVWSTWRAGRTTTLAELHHLALKRERTRLCARLSGGIAASLLILGIAGTLGAVTPILSDFRLSQDPNGWTDHVVNQDKTVRLVHDLGTAFAPSLTALTFTLLVAILRGLYVHKANHLARALDHFVIQFLLPTFPPRSVGSELTEISDHLHNVADRLLKRDKEWGEAIEIFKEFVMGLKGATRDLQKAVDKAKNTSDGLAGNISSALGNLEGYLGKGSPLVKAIQKFGLAAEVVGSTSETIKMASDAASGAAESAGRSAQVLEEAIGRIPTHIESGCTSGSELLAESARKGATLLEVAAKSLVTAADQAHERLKNGFDQDKATVADIVRSAAQDGAAAISSVADTLAASAASVQAGAEDVKQAGHEFVNGWQTAVADAREKLTNGAHRASDQISSARDKLGLAVSTLEETIRRIPLSASEKPGWWMKLSRPFRRKR